MSAPQQDAAKKPKMIMAVLFLERLAPINYDAMIQRVGGTLGIDAAAMGDQKPSGPMVMPVDGDVVYGLSVDVPYPELGALKGIAPFAYWWPNALNDLARSKAHMMVTCAWAKHSRLDAHMRQMVLVRELMEQLPVIGVLWGSSLVQTDVFKDQFAIATKGGFPFSLWILIQFSKQPNGNILISTLGMCDFEQMEIETESSLPLDQTFDLVRDLGSYILNGGAVVKDGDTFGLSATQKIRVRHAPSFRPGANQPVYWLELTEQPTVHKSKGFFNSLFGSSTRR